MRTVFTSRLSAVALLLLQACDASSPTSPTTGTAPVRGTVVDFQTQAPLPGVVVRVATDPAQGGVQATTDTSGRYVLPQALPAGAVYYFTVNDMLAGRGYPAGADYRGDLLVNGGTCVARYGVVLDARTLRPIPGATVGAFTTTASDGWYRVDWGCPDSGTIGFNTAVLTATHPRYTSQDQVLGRGIQGVQRLDFLLTPN